MRDRYRQEDVLDYYLGDGETSWEVEYSYFPGSEAVAGVEPDDSRPPEAEQIDLLSVWTWDGHEVQEDELERHREAIEEAIRRREARRE